ncbi:MAG TPA: hypothetical protein VGL86_08915 [Polyangia bacterium]|jgi:hypothetical protein
MDELDLIAAYVRKLEEALARAGRPVQPLAGEAAAHLAEDAARIARAEGCGDAEAARRAIARFGDVSSVVAASRKNGRAFAASIARMSSILLLAVLGWGVVTDVVDRGLEFTDFMFVFCFMFCDLGLVSYFLFRALRGQTRSGALSIIPALNGALAAALISTQLLVDGRQTLSNHHSLFGLVWMIEPAWLLMLVQSVAGLWALGARRNQEGELIHG